jgi:hypothetical protein
MSLWLNYPLCAITTAAEERLNSSGFSIESVDFMACMISGVAMHHVIVWARKSLAYANIYVDAWVCVCAGVYACVCVWDEWGCVCVA